jgi:hypothetical protein
VEYAGVAFERLYDKTPDLEIDSANGLRTDTRQRDHGVFYTPPSIVQFLTRSTLEPLLSAVSTSVELLQIQVCDPAMGTGFFLLESLRQMSVRLVELSSSTRELSPAKAKELVAKHCLYGVDRDPLAVRITKALIWLEVGLTSFELSGMDQHFRVGDALLDSRPAAAEPLNSEPQEHAPSPANCRVLTSTQKRTGQPASSTTKKTRLLGDLASFDSFNWESAFPEVFANAQGLRKADSGFAVILSNPPWGKIKPDLKEFHAHLDRAVSQYQGSDLRHYIGTSSRILRLSATQAAWDQYSGDIRRYAEVLQTIGTYKHQRVQANNKSTGGDADLYKYFMERAFQLVSPNGRIGLVVPSAFHRSEGATGIRKLYFDNGGFEHFNEFENRKRLFPIHPMFRFVLLVYERGAPGGIQQARFGLSSIDDLENNDLEGSNPLQITPQFLQQVGGELLTIPEVRSRLELSLLDKLYKQHPKLGQVSEAGWHVSFVRELDMTNDHHIFNDIDQLLKLKCRPTEQGLWISPTGERYVPLYEGRMVHQFDCMAKAYRGGQGRTSTWEPLNSTHKVVAPHYYVSETQLEGKRLVWDRPRAGYCDVTGHANERTVLSALIPGGAVCGNKVPTCVFDVDDPRLQLIWVALASSFVVDWLVRRRISTTLNFFHWYQIPLPRVNPDSIEGQMLLEAASSLSFPRIRPNGKDIWFEHPSWARFEHVEQAVELKRRAQLRARIDAIVAELYALTSYEYASILSDFPLLDRFQQPLPLTSDGPCNPCAPLEPQSTITRDKALLEYFALKREVPPNNIKDVFDHKIAGGIVDLRQRVQVAERLGATAYIPSEVLVQRQRVNASL